MIHIDGNHGEGGGQIVRTALALSTLTQRPFRMTGIRAGRPQPGLKAQHLSAISALKEICGARTNEVAVRSGTLVYEPGPVAPGEYKIDIGTAGSIALLLQALFLPLIFTGGATTLYLRGGTCGKWQAPVEYYQLVLLPYLRRFAGIDLQLLRRGYYPKGGGRVRLTVTPSLQSWRDAARLSPYDLTGRGPLLRIEGVSHAAQALKQRSVAERQAASARELLSVLGCPSDIAVDYHDTFNPGSGIALAALFGGDSPEAPHRLGADALGEKGLPAEEVGRQAAGRLLNHISAGAPADEHLSDQLIPFLALIPGSRMRVASASDHLLSNIYVVEQFLPVKFRVEDNLVEVV